MEIIFVKFYLKMEEDKLQENWIMLSVTDFLAFLYSIETSYCSHEKV